MKRDQDLIEYLSDRLPIVKAGTIRGSHLMGVFQNAATMFEMEIRSYAVRLLESCHLQYEGDLRRSIDGPIFPRTTLGILVAVIKEARKRSPKEVAARIPDQWSFSGFIDVLERVNYAWVETKHGEEFTVDKLIAQMESMLLMTKLLRKQQW